MHSSKPKSTKTYVALGDSMSIDDYTGVKGGGAAAQFHKKFSPEMEFIFLAVDGCTIPNVPRDQRGDIITLTIGGNDAMTRMDELLQYGVEQLLKDHLQLLTELRQANPKACIIVGNIYEPQSFLPDEYRPLLLSLNEGIKRNVVAAGCSFADIHAAFKGNEAEYLCRDIEPTYAGAKAIASAFAFAFREWVSATSIL